MLDPGTNEPFWVNLRAECIDSGLTLIGASYDAVQQAHVIVVRTMSGGTLAVLVKDGYEGKVEEVLRAAVIV